MPRPQSRAVLPARAAEPQFGETKARRWIRNFGRSCNGQEGNVEGREERKEMPNSDATAGRDQQVRLTGRLS